VRRSAFWFVALLIFSGLARGEVRASAPMGFVVVHDLTLAGSPTTVYDAITAEVAKWWDASHSYSGEARNFSMDARAGGCFCERLADGGSVEHLRVLFAGPGNLLRLSGGLGPLQGMGATGVMDFSLSPAQGGRTRLEFRYSVGGYTEEGLETLADPVDTVLGGQLARLAAYLATGSPTAP
jgi:uncharacterized protein YndB with AHSA1/START domain